MCILGQDCRTLQPMKFNVPYLWATIVLVAPHFCANAFDHTQRECFGNLFTYTECCYRQDGGLRRCWNGRFTYESCCLPRKLPVPVDQWSHMDNSSRLFLGNWKILHVNHLSPGEEFILRYPKAGFEVTENLVHCLDGIHSNLSITTLTGGVSFSQEVKTKSRIIHLIREPFTLVVSAFHHLKKGVEAFLWAPGSRSASRPGWPGMAWDGARTAWQYGVADWYWLFRPCNFSCSIFDLLQNAPVDIGLEVAFRLVRSQLSNMLRNMGDLLDHRHVLHISVDQIRRNPSRAWACILRFMGLAQLKQTSFKSCADHDASVESHSTAWQMRREAVEVALTASWAAELKRGDGFIKAVLEASSRSHVCPSPHEAPQLRSVRRRRSKLGLVQRIRLSEYLCEKLQRKEYGAIFSDNSKCLNFMLQQTCLVCLNHWPMGTASVDRNWTTKSTRWIFDCVKRPGIWYSSKKECSIHLLEWAVLEIRCGNIWHEGVNKNNLTNYEGGCDPMMLQLAALQFVQESTKIYIF